MARRLARESWHTPSLVVYKMFLVFFRSWWAVFPVSRAPYAFTDRLLGACSLAPKLLLLLHFITTLHYSVSKTHAGVSCLETNYLDGEWLKAINTCCLTVSESDRFYCDPLEFLWLNL